MSQLLRGRYRREAILRRGEAATTILARDTKTDRLCVVKSLYLPAENAPDLLRLLQRESRAYATLSDPRIPRLIDGFPHQHEDDRMSYVLVTEYVEGRDLARVVREGGVYGEAQALALLRSLAGLLDPLHSHQPRLAHRAVRPEKVIVDPAGEPHLVDFGSWSRAMRRLLGPEGAKAPADPRGYSPPEDLAGDAVPASDVYSLGATVAFALTGKDPAELGAAALPVSPQPRRVLRRMLAEKVQDRYADAGEVLRALDEPTPSAVLLDRRVAAAAAATLALTVFFLARPSRLRVAPAARQPSAVTTPSPEPSAEPTDPPFRQPSPEARPSARQQVTAGGPRRDYTLRSTTPAPREPSEVAQPAVWARDGRLSIDVYRDFKYVAAGSPGGLATGQTNATALGTRPQERLYAEPRYASPSVLYGCLKLGNGPDPLVTFVLDELEHPTWVVWVDKNNNQDLTDDGPPLSNQGSGLLVAGNLSLEIEVQARGSSPERRPYKIWLWVSEVANPPPGAPRYAARFYAVCHYAGRVELLGEVFDAVAFEERGHDGLLAEDGIWVDLDRDGKFQPAEHFLDGKEIRTERGWWILRIEHP